MWYVYGLRCKDNSIYVGSTGNVHKRLEQHRNGETVSLRLKLPVFLEFYIAVRNEATARKLEKYLKMGSGRAITKKRFLAGESTKLLESKTCPPTSAEAVA